MSALPRVSSAASLGPSIVWARDFALIGGASSFLAPLLVVGEHFGSLYLAASALAGAATGAVVGVGLHRALRGLGGRLPVGLLLLVVPLAGALWGAAVGISSGQILPNDWWAVSGICAAVAACAQLAWLWLPYAVLRGRGKPVWPLVVFACSMPVLATATAFVLDAVF